MKIINQHKNGVVLQSIKSYAELTDDERESLTIPATSNITDYKDFVVHRNKKDEIIRVVTNSFTDEKADDINESVDLVDALEVVYGEKGTTKNNKAKKRVNDKLSTINNSDYENLINAKQADFNIIKEVIDSELSAYRIEDITGVSRTTLSNIRNGKADILNLSFANAIKLTSFGLAAKGNLL